MYSRISCLCILLLPCPFGILATPDAQETPSSALRGASSSTDITEPEDLYDVIIVGAGLAGSVVAGKLSENAPGHRILLLEAGQASQRDLGGTDPPASWSQAEGAWSLWPGSYNGLTRYDVPGNYVTLNSWNQQPDDVWKGYPGGIYQCKILGGCDVLNGALRQIPPKTMFDSSWPEGWKWADMEKYYDEAKQIFDLSPTPSTDGKHYLNDTGADTYMEALSSAGYSMGDALMPKANLMGIPVVSTVNGVRQSTAVAYLPGALQRSNFAMKIASEVTAIIMNGSTATGVVYTEDSNEQVASLKPNGLVVLSAGVFGTVKLLLESNIQNGDVGKGVSDHGYRNLQFTAPSDVRVESFSSEPPPKWSSDEYNEMKIGPLTQFGPTFVSYTRGPSTWGPADVFDVEAFVGYDGEGAVSMGLAMLRPNCSSTDLYLEGGELQFSHDELYSCSKDIETMDDAATKISEAMRQRGASPITPVTGSPSGSFDAANHWAGGCSLGRCLDPDTMLVRGTSNVAVADSSLFPTTIWSHPSLTCAVTAAKAADILAEQLNKGSGQPETDSALLGASCDFFRMMMYMLIMFVGFFV